MEREENGSSSQCSLPLIIHTTRLLFILNRIPIKHFWRDADISQVWRLKRWLLPSMGRVTVCMAEETKGIFEKCSSQRSFFKENPRFCALCALMGFILNSVDCSAEETTIEKTEERAKI